VKDKKKSRELMASSELRDTVYSLWSKKERFKYIPQIKELKTH
jgi:hypothetical protein